MQYEQKKEIPLWVFRAFCTVGFGGSIVLGIVALALSVRVGAEGTTTGILVMILGCGGCWLTREEINQKFEPISKRELVRQAEIAQDEFTVCSFTIHYVDSDGQDIIRQIGDVREGDSEEFSA